VAEHVLEEDCADSQSGFPDLRLVSLVLDSFHAARRQESCIGNLKFKQPFFLTEIYSAEPPSVSIVKEL
jgi:hypothetical protein